MWVLNKTHFRRNTPSYSVQRTIIRIWLGASHTLPNVCIKMFCFLVFTICFKGHIAYCNYYIIIHNCLLTLGCSMQHWCWNTLFNWIVIKRCVWWYVLWCIKYIDEFVCGLLWILITFTLQCLNSNGKCNAALIRTICFYMFYIQNGQAYSYNSCKSHELNGRLKSRLCVMCIAAA
jgi:hypothetical protein